MQQWADYFGGFAQEELGELLASNQNLATRYAEVQHWQAGQQNAASSDQVAAAGQVYAAASQIRTFNSMLEESDLPPEKLAELKPENFTHLGTPGLAEWGKAVYSAILAHRTEEAVNNELKTRWEAYKQEHLAEIDGDTPPEAHAGGGPGPRRMDIMSTPSEVGLEAAFNKKQKAR